MVAKQVGQLNYPAALQHRRQLNWQFLASNQSEINMTLCFEWDNVGKSHEKAGSIREKLLEERMDDECLEEFLVFLV